MSCLYLRGADKAKIIRVELTKQFKRIATHAGVKGLVVGDLDKDGRPDFIISHVNEPMVLLRNVSARDAHWLGVELVGRDRRDVVGARLVLAAGGVRGNGRPMGRMQAIGMAWTYLHQYRSVDDELKAFDAVTLKSIRKALDRYPLEQTTTLALGPLATLGNQS